MFRKLTFFLWVIPLITLSFYCSPKINQYENLLDAVFAKPEYLSLHRDSVRLNIQGALPIRYLSTDVRIDFYPEYQYGDAALKLGMFTPFDGEYAVPHSETRINRSIVFPYLPGMEKGKLVLKAQLTKKGRSYIIPEKRLAIGLNTAPLLARIGQITPDEPIQEIGRYMEVDFSGMATQELREFMIPFYLGSTNFDGLPEPLLNLLQRGESGMQVNEIKIVGLHSPESAEISQIDLPRKRAEQLKTGVYAQIGSSTVPTSIAFRKNDWFDFRLLLSDYEELSADEKEQFYQILQTDLGFEDKLRQMKKLKSFNQVARDIFPKMRSAKVTVVLENTKLSDPEISANVYKLLKENQPINDFSIEHLVYAGQQAKRLQEREAIYAKLIALAPSALSFNNLGVVYLNQAQRELGLRQRNELINKAIEMFRQSNRDKPSAIAMHNLGRALILRKDYFDAYVAISEASGLERDENNHFLRYNEGIRGALDIINGDYKLAVIRLNRSPENEVNLFNKGLAYFLAEEHGQAAIAFEESVQVNREFGYGFYGLAMIAASNRDRQALYEYLQKAIEQSAYLKERALYDIQFAPYREEREFMRLF